MTTLFSRLFSKLGRPLPSPRAQARQTRRPAPSVEALESRIAPASIITLNSGTGQLTVQGDYVDDGSATTQIGAQENLAFTVSGGTLFITDTAGHHVTSSGGPGLTQVTTSQVSVALSQVTGGIAIDLGYETFGSPDTLDFSNDLTLSPNTNFSAHAQGLVTVESGAHLGTTGTGTLSIVTETNLAVAGSITTVDGNMTLSAGQSGQPSGAFAGIAVSGAGALVQSTGLGNITLMGLGGDTGDRAVGVTVTGGGAIMGGTSGLLSITGVGGASGGNYNFGVSVEGANSTIGSAGAAVSILGTGGGQFASVFNYGVYLVDGGTITAGGAGTVTVEGHAGYDSGGGGGFSAGISLEGQVATPATITSSGGDVTLRGFAGTAETHVAIQIGDGSGPAGWVTNPNGGAVHLQGDSIAFGPNSGVTTSGAGNSVSIVPTTPGINIVLGSTFSVDGVSIALSSALLSQITTNSLQIGDGTNAGDIDTAADLTLSSDLVLDTLGNIVITNHIDLSADHNAIFTAGANIDFNSGSGLSVHGAGAISMNAGAQLSLGAGTAASVSISAENGPITLFANEGTSHPVGNYVGVLLNGASITSSGGLITIMGQGGDSGDQNIGILVETTTISGGASGPAVSMDGLGGLSPGNQNYGIEVLDGGSTITSSGGDVSVQGTGGGFGPSTQDNGIHMDQGATIMAGGLGGVTVVGTGSSGAAGGPSVGVEVTGFSTITSSGGNVGVLGSGAGLFGGPPSAGVELTVGGSIQAGGTGGILIQGSSGSSGAPGVHVDGESFIGSPASPVTIATDFIALDPGSMVSFANGEITAMSTTVSGLLSGSLQGTSLQFDGSSALTLSGTATVADFQIFSGSLLLATANALQGSTVDLNTTANLQFGSGLGTVMFGGLSGPGNLDLADIASGTVNLQVGFDNADTAYVGTLGGAGTLTKVGLGTLTLVGGNTFTGATNIMAGSLEIANPVALQNSTVTITHSTDLKFQSGTDTVVLGGLKGSVALNLADEFGEDVNLEVGNNGEDTTYSGNIGPSGMLTKVGSGTLTLSGHNTMAGGIALQEGVLQVSSAQNLGTIDSVIFGQGGTLNATQSFTTSQTIELMGETTTFEASAGKTLTLSGSISGAGSLAYGSTGTVKVTGGDNDIQGSMPLNTTGTTMVNGAAVSSGGVAGVTVMAGPNPGEIAMINVSGVSAAKTVNLTIKAPKNSTTTVDEIVNTNAAAHVNSIILGAGVTLGNGVADDVPDLAIAGKINNLQLNNVAANTIIDLGKGLDYHSTYANHPNVTLNNVMGAGVVIDVTGDGQTAAGVGGGGLGKVVINSWSDPGTIMTTQSIKSLTVKHGNFGGDVQLDPNHLGEFTTASIGSVSIPNGQWTGTGMQVEGVIAKFLTKGLAEGSTIEAGAFGAVTIKGNYGGSVVATADPSVTNTVKGKTTVVATGKIASVSIAGDFTGLISGDGAVGNVTLTGSARFEGSVRGASVGNITAASFTGTSETGGPSQTITAAGSIGNITATAGSVADYIIAAGTALDATAQFDANTTYAACYTNAAGKMMAVQVGNVTVKGDLTGTTIVAGVNPGVAMVNSVATYGVYGDGDDAAVALPAGAIGKTKLGALKFDTGSAPTISISPSDPSTVTNAFEAQAMTSLQIGKVKSSTTYLSSFTQAQYIDDGDGSTIVQILA